MSKILIVEDNELNMKLFYDLLIMKDHEVITSIDGKNITKLVLNEKPELILMDIQLNGISGIDLIKDLKQNELTKQIPIIAITAFAMKNDETLISNSGCDMYMTKPVALESFFSAIENFTTPTMKV